MAHWLSSTTGFGLSITLCSNWPAYTKKHLQVVWNSQISGEIAHIYCSILALSASTSKAVQTGPVRSSMLST